jgi:glucoamylase
MSLTFGLIGNGRVLAKVQADGALTEAFFPSIGFYRHIMQSQFGLYEKKTEKSLWFSSREFEAEQHYIEDTNVLQTFFKRGGLRFTLTDFVHAETNVIVRTLEVRNLGRETAELGIFHMEASSLEENKGNFGHNVAYFNSLDNHVVRYRGHPFDNTVEAHACLLIAGCPVQDQLQCGVSFQSDGVAEDAYLDVADGTLRHNAYSSGDSMGTTSALLWMRSIPPGGSAEITVYLSGAGNLLDAEEQLAAARRRGPEGLLRSCTEYWREWLEISRAHAPDLPERRLQLLYRRSLLVLKLLHDERYGSFIAAPNLYPDYRYCWPRDAVYLAWTMDRCGYHDESRRFYRWCKRTQMADGLWYQNHYTDGRRHWPGIQVDQVGSILWGLHQHYLACRVVGRPSAPAHPRPAASRQDLGRVPASRQDLGVSEAAMKGAEAAMRGAEAAEKGAREFLQEMWPTVERAAWYILSRIDPEIGLVYSEQDLWEETGGYLAYTNGTCVAGLRAAAAIARELGQEEEARLWPECAETLRVQMQRHLIQDGIYVGEYTPNHPFAVRQDYVLDVSNLGIAVPFGVIPADAPEMVHTVELIEKACDYPVGGVGRYASDLFVGGNPWSLSALWLALYYVEAGQVSEARRHLDWCLRHTTTHDFIPEQSDKRTGEPASAVPLGWSHAWMVVLLQGLGAVKGDGRLPAPARSSQTARAPASVPARERRP